MKNTQPIGIFDSGVGGISVMSHIQSLLPNESLAYVADSLFAPYGLKSKDVILERSKTAIDYLIKKRVVYQMDQQGKTPLSYLIENKDVNRITKNHKIIKNSYGV